MGDFEKHVVGALEGLAAAMRSRAHIWLGGSEGHAGAMGHIEALRALVDSASEGEASEGGGRGRTK